MTQPTNNANLTAEQIDDDTFAYDAPAGHEPLLQCISGFGRNAKTHASEAMSRLEEGFDQTPADIQRDRERTEWHIDELVRWCRHFNGKSKRLESDLARLRAENGRLRTLLAEAAEDVADWGDYADGYFKEKHGLADTVQKYRAAAARSAAAGEGQHA